MLSAATRSSAGPWLRLAPLAVATSRSPGAKSSLTRIGADAARNGRFYHQARRLLSDKAKDTAAAKDAVKEAGAATAKAAGEETKKSWWTSAEFWGGLGAIAGWGSEFRLALGGIFLLMCSQDKHVICDVVFL